MRIGELLVVKGLVSPDEVEVALERQKREGGPIGRHLIAMGAISKQKLWEVLPGLQRWQGMHGPDHPNTHRARYSYARALLAAGRPFEASRHAQTALAGYRVTVGEKHAWTQEALELIAEAKTALATRASQVADDPAARAETAARGPQPVV